MRSTVEVAESAGFCFGVRRALERIEALVKVPRTGRLVTLGPLLHNRPEVERLRGLGVLSVDETQLCSSDEVVVRTHGATPGELRALEARAAAVHDLTCPYVRSLQTLARRMAGAGYATIVVGDHGHPEVAAVLSWAKEACADKGSAVVAVSSTDELRAALPRARASRKVAVLAQTTQTPERLRQIVACLLDELGPPVTPAAAVAPSRRGLLELRVLDTICPATRQRQAEARSLASAVELMLVVGDRQSANARRLLEVCRAAQPRSELVLGQHEIDPDWLRGVRRVAVSGGASTPLHAIREVVAWLRDLDHE